MSALVIALCGAHLRAWHFLDGVIQPLTILGDDTTSVQKPETLGHAANEALQRTSLPSTALVHWVLDADGRQLFAKALGTGALPTPHWQVWDWHWLGARWGIQAPNPWSIEDTWQQSILPWIFEAEQRCLAEAQHAALEQAFAQTRAEHEQTLAALRAENERLRAHNLAYKQMDMERLMSYLPALFEAVFTTLAPTDIALLCGRLEPMNLPNPYPEPAGDTLQALQQRFLALAPAHQREIIAWVHALPHRQKLKVRPAMRDIVQAIEAELSGAARG